VPSSLTLREAQRIADAAIDESKRRSALTAVAVVDDRGDLVVAARLDGTRSYHAHVAYGKAIASALWQVPSKGLAQNSQTNTVQQRVNALNGGRLVFAAGAVPLLREGVLIGAVGVGGAAGDGDEEIAAVAAGVL